MIRNKFSQGITIVEVLFFIVLLALSAGFLVPAGLSFMQRNDLELATTSTIHAFRSAQMHARASDGDTSWGVHVEQGKVIIFSGTSFTSRDQTKDDVITMSNGIMPSGMIDCIFQNFTGTPNTTGTVQLSTPSGLSKTVTVSSLGLISTP